MNRSAWYIDALDARGGLAFASRREAYREEGSPTVDGPAIFVGPPEFQPQVLQHRALGLSAARGSFQAGLFLEGTEVGFSSLAALSEFVRRTYLKGGSFDGPDRGGNGPPAPAPFQSPSGDPQAPDSQKVVDDAEHDRSLGLVTSAVNAFVHLSDEQALGESAQVTWNLEGETVAPGTKDSALGEVARMLASELRMRKPPPASDAKEMRRWQRAAGALATLAAAQAAHVGDILDYSSDPAFTDPLEMLELVPIPQTIAHAIGVASPQTASVLDALCAFVGAPRKVTQPALDLIVFAAVCITSWGDNWRRFRDAELPLQEALKWLELQFPTRVYSRLVEDAIAEGIRKIEA